jgi:hypothetical protein
MIKFTLYLLIPHSDTRPTYQRQRVFFIEDHSIAALLTSLPVCRKV